MSLSAPTVYARWYRAYRSRPGHRLRLICFPHAGGSATFYRGWIKHLPDSVELLIAQYPGREDRLLDDLVEELGTLADQLAEALAPTLDQPFALFGHSMGATVAFEVAQRLERRWDFAAERLIVSGRPAPHRQRSTAVHRRDDEALVAELRRLGGTTAEALQHAELRELLLPSIRSDYRLIETYRPAGPTRVRAPITAVIGVDDTEVDSAEAGAWRDCTNGGFSLWTMPGGHFYLVERERELVTELLRVLCAGATALRWPSTP